MITPGNSYAGQDFSNQNLTQADFSGCDCTGCSFNGATLLNVHMMGATLTNATFTGANMRYAVLTGADATSAVFDGADLTSAVLARCTLTQASFNGSTLAKTVLTQTALDGTIFDNDDLTTCIFSLPAAFSAPAADGSAPAYITSMQGATLPMSLIGYNWSCLNLTGATINGLAGLDLTGLVAQYAVLSGMDFSDRVLNSADFTGATINPVTPAGGGSAVPASFAGAQLQSAIFDYASCVAANFGPDTNGTPTNLSGASLTHAVLSGANIAGAFFNGATLTFATMDNVTGDSVQFGAIAQAFQVSAADTAAVEQILWNNTGGASGPASLVPYFTQNGIDLSTNLGPLTMTAGMWQIADGSASYTVILTSTGSDSSIAFYSPGGALSLTGLSPAALNTANVAAVNTALQAVNGPTLSSAATITVQRGIWTLQDMVSNIVYTIRQDLGSGSGASSIVTVSEPAVAASMDYVYMPDAVLTNANFYNVKAANEIQIYGDLADLTGANLEGAIFSGGNLSSMSLSATMYGITLTNAILVGTSFGTANLTPSSEGGSATLSGANLLGATMTDAQLFAVDLSGASVGVALSAPAGAAAGMWLANMPLSGTDYVNVLNNASTQYILSKPTHADFIALRTALNNPSTDLTTVIAAFQAVKITISNNAQITPIGTPQPTWEIVDQTAGVTYSVWSALDANGNNELYVLSDAANAAIFSLNPGGNSAAYQSVSTALTTAAAQPTSSAMAVIVSAFQKQKVTLDSTSTVSAAQTPDAWLVTDTQNYTVWSEAALSPGGGALLWQIFAQCSLGDFATNFTAQTLRPQATVSVVTANSIWALNNDAGNPQNFDIGYMEFQLQLTPDGTGLDVYGTSIQVEVLGPDNQLQIIPSEVNVTSLQPSNLSADSLCPNGNTLSHNQETGSSSWNDWMRANSPPKPPVCVPNKFSYCQPPTSSTTSTSAKGGRARAVRKER
jgi:uncharacterized protein YjbI with pentapeptide repeats